MAVLGAVFAAAGGGVSFADGYGPAIAVSALLGALGTAAALLLPGRHTATAPRPLAATSGK